MSVSLLVLCPASGCLQVQKEHCVFSGGDIGNRDEGVFCVIPTSSAERTVSEVDGEGHLLPAGNEVVPEGYIHMPFGIPRRLEAQDDDRDPQSVLGVVRLALELEGSPWCPELRRSLGGLWDEELEGPSGRFYRAVDGRRMGLRGLDVDSGLMMTLNASIEDQINGCVDAGTAPEASVEVDDDDDDDDDEAPETEEGSASSGEPACEDHAECEAVDAARPLCVNGRCVECASFNDLACRERRMVCDEDIGECVGCVAHSECRAGACELAKGRCFPERAKTVNVGGRNGGEGLGSIAEAIDQLKDEEYGIINVRGFWRGLSAGYSEDVVVDGGTVALFFAEGDASAVKGGEDEGLPIFKVEGSSTSLYIEGMKILNSGRRGVSVDGALVWLDRSRVVSGGGAVDASGGARLVLRNSIILANDSALTALGITDASLDMNYSTVVGAEDVQYFLSCTNGSRVAVRNSVMLTLNDGGAGACDPAEIETSIARGLAESGIWFIDLAGGLRSGDLELSEDGKSEFRGRARWRDGDPTVDIDGDPRPSRPGTVDYVGADVPRDEEAPG